MSSPEYGHLLLAPLSLFAAVYYAFSQRLFGQASRWPWPIFPGGGLPMSAFSRWLLFSLCTALALKEIARGLFHLKPSDVVVALHLLFVIALGAAFLHDRRRARAKG
jgi:hypothetical protein